MNEILLLSNANHPLIEQAKSLVSAYENEHVKFSFQTAKLSDENVIGKAKSAHAVLFVTTTKEEDKAVESIRKNLNLYAQITVLSSYIDGVNRELCIVQDKNGGIYHGEKGFGNNRSFGREAYDTERYSELEIERTARVAYEYTQERARHLTLCDKADMLNSSKLWRKVVADVNEDYPFVTVDMQDITATAKAIITSLQSLDTIVTTALFGDILTSVATSVFGSAPSISFVGDTPLAMYGFNLCEQSNVSQNSIESLICFAMQNSFGIE